MSKLPKEERARVLVRAWLACPDTFAEFALGIVREQDAREGPLVDALRRICSRGIECHLGNDSSLSCVAIARAALATYDALDAKPEPSVAEALEACEPLPGQLVEVNGQACLLVPRAKWNAVMAAVEREERCAGEGKR